MHSVPNRLQTNANPLRITSAQASVTTTRDYMNWSEKIKLRKAKSRSFLNGFSRMWQGWQDSNPQPSVLETAVLPIGTTPLLTWGIMLKPLPKVKDFLWLTRSIAAFSCKIANIKSYPHFPTQKMAIHTIIQPAFNDVIRHWLMAYRAWNPPSKFY